MAGEKSTNPSGSTNIHAGVKYRPPLTLAQIQDITGMLIYLESRVSIDENVDMSKITPLKKIFIPLISKVEVGAINPAYKLSEQHAIKIEESQRRKRYESGDMSREEEMLYESEVIGL